MAEKKKLSRRKFIVRSLLGGTGVLVGVGYLGRNSLRRSLFEIMEDPDSLAFMGNTDSPQMWFEITAQNVITLHSPKVEMGQGSFTSLAQMAADELEVDVDQVQVVHAASATGNVDGLSTGGSTSVAGLWQPLRELAATMREMLRIEAASKMGVEIATVQNANGVFTSGSQRLTYGETAAGVEEWEIPDTPALKPVDKYQFIGKPVPRVDLIDKVVGTPMFGMDAAMPGMLYGAVVRPSKIGARYKGADVSGAVNMPGVVRVVEEPDFVGVIAETQVQAENAKKAIRVEWEVEREWSTQDIKDMTKVGMGESLVIQKNGSTQDVLSEAAEAGSEDYLEVEFTTPIGAHAQIEPNGALASVEANSATVMISTQVVGMTRKEVADRLGLDEDQVNVVPTFLGGGFGRRLHTPHAVQAAVMSKAVGKPVKCFFDRKEEFQNDTFRPPTHHIMRGKLTEGGTVEAIEHQFASGDVAYNSALLPGFANTILGTDMGAIRGGTIQYRQIPHFRSVSWHVDLPFATSWWRSLGLLANTFAIESFMDELALKAGKDPAQFRLDHVADDAAGQRLRKVLETAVVKSGYKDEVVDGKAMGFAASTDAGTPCAHVVEVSVSGKKIQVEKVTCVIDPGFAVNPDQVRAQCEGCINMGISAAMFERMYVEKSELRPTIYGAYPMALLRDAPKEIDVEIINGTGKPGAVGEPPLGPIGAAIANAVFRLTGTRLRDLPLSLENV